MRSVKLESLRRLIWELTRLRWWDQRFVRLYICRITEQMSRGSPIAEVVFVMCVEGCDIEEKGSSIFPNGRISVPAVTMDEAGLYRSAF